MNLQTFGVGRILAIVGLILTIIFIVVSHLEILPIGLLFLLAFGAMLF